MYIETDKCIGCGWCQKECFYDAIRIASVNAGEKSHIKGIVINFSVCNCCHGCERVCPTGAIQLQSCDGKGQDDSDWDDFDWDDFDWDNPNWNNPNWGGGGGGGGGYTPPEPEVDDEGLEDTEAGCVKKKLEAGGESSLLNELLAGFKLDKSKINIIYKTGTVPNKSTGGKTVPKLKNGNPVFGDLIITIDLDNWMNQTSIGLAYTILHETLHAYLFGQKWAKDLHNNAGGVEVSFADLWKEYESIYGRYQTQHQFMATHYIEPMKEAMKLYFEQLAYYDSFMNYVADNTEWKGVDAMMEALVWRGLKGTEVWKSLSEAAKKKINKQDNLFLRKDLNKPGNCE